MLLVHLRSPEKTGPDDAKIILAQDENGIETNVFDRRQKQLISYTLGSYAVFFYYLHCPFKKMVLGCLVGKNFIV